MNEVLEGPGEALQAARKAMEISCREVAEALNLPIRTIEAIEANDYENLPAAVFTRGYIRSYAKLLELDADPVVARYSEDGDHATEMVEAVPGRPLQVLIRDYPQWILGVAGVAAFIVLMSLAVWLWPATDEPGPPEPARPNSQEAAGVDPADAHRQAPTAVTGPVPAPEPVIERPTANQPVAEESAFVAATPVLVANTLPGVGRITPIGRDRLRFQFSDDCWVEIKSATGASLYSDLSRGGSTLELVGQAPFRILLGYAPGVALSFNSEVVALAPHTLNNVANLVLGH